MPSRICETFREVGHRAASPRLWWGLELPEEEWLGWEAKAIGFVGGACPFVGGSASGHPRHRVQILRLRRRRSNSSQITTIARIYPPLGPLERRWATL